MRGLYTEGLIFGGAYIRREVCVSKSARLILAGKSTGLAYSWKEICVSNLPKLKVLTGTRLEDVNLSKRPHASLLTIWTEEIKAKSEEELRN